MADNRLRPIGSRRELAAVLRRPLEFASRNGYANAALVDGLGAFLSGVLARASGIAEVRALADELADGLSDWGAAPVPRRVEIVRRWTTLLESASEGAGAAPGHQSSPSPPPRVAKPAPAEWAKHARVQAKELSATARATPKKRKPKPAAAAAAAARRTRGPLDTPVIELKGVGPKIADRLAVRGLRAVRDLLWFLPRRYSVRPPPAQIADLQAGDEAAVVGRVRAHQGGWARRGRRPTFRMDIEDASGVVGVRFFGLSGGFLTRRFPLGERVLVAGKVEEYRDRLEFSHPEASPLAEGESAADAEGRITPVYLDVDGVAPGSLRRLIAAALDGFADAVPDGVPTSMAEARGLPSAATALELVHRPAGDADAADLVALRTHSWRRLIFEELFIFQMGIALRRRASRAVGDDDPDGAAGAPVLGRSDDGEVLGRYLRALPFELTAAQSRVLAEIRGDLSQASPMNRLLQGDVGSGKTAVAMAAAAVAVGAGAQVAVMAPTELLAAQHLRTFRQQLGEGAGAAVAELVGGMRKRARSDELRRLLAGTTDVVVGTHALLQDDVAFRQLGLVIVDEQHRFGVRQRLALRQKGQRPHVLVMTATPIPRSLSLTLYGDLDVSVIDERPPGRGPVVTEVVPEARRDHAYQRVCEELDAGRQAYMVYPVVGDGPDDAAKAEAAGRDELRAATTMVEELRAGPLRGHTVGLIHGRMSPSEKEAVMADFSAGRIGALVATTVIEVGIDVPSATVMVVEHAERFGLAQLHQLRGRIGRGGQGVASLCLLIASDAPGRNAEERLRTLERTDDGFAIAEADLLQRGPGEFLGVRQSGLPRFEVADLLRDGDVLRDAREAAFELVDADPSLRRHPKVREAVEERWAGNVELVEVG